MPDPAYLSGPGRPRRPNIMARHHVVVSGHYYASLAGLQILEAGGNAIDAGVATGLAIDVLESQYVGFCGVAPVMIHLAERGETLVINGVGVWPRAARVDYFHQQCGGRIPDGLLQTVVPAAPANWIAALERFGTMSFGDVAASAIRFARDGFPTYPFFAEILAARQAEILRSFCRTGTRPRWARSSGKPISAARCSTWRIRRRPTRAAIGLSASMQRMMRSIAATSPARSCGIRRSMAAGWSPRIWRNSAAVSNRRVAFDSATSMSTAAARGRRDRWCWRR